MSLTTKQIDELRAYAKDRKGELAKMITDAADTIEMLSAKLHASQMERSSQYYHGGWIPVGERLPAIKEHHVSEPCIVYCENGAYGFAELQENIFGQAGWNCERDDEYHEALGTVLAWMPLPPAYQDEGENR